jgi:hypothetical protein
MDVFSLSSFTLLSYTTLPLTRTPEPLNHIHLRPRARGMGVVDTGQFLEQSSARRAARIDLAGRQF